METGKAIHSVAENIGEILLVSLVLAVCVGLGSVMTQYMLKLTPDYSITVALMVIFGVITAFGGVVFSLLKKR
ncbi:MAG: hypothetical protein ACM3NG_00055 [Candidatus Doudnabacteria bacterium]